MVCAGTFGGTLSGAHEIEWQPVAV